MEPYFDRHHYVPQDYGIHRGTTNEKMKKSGNIPNQKEGSYGVSIRVQGIDGHPYIVLNNKEGCLSNPSSSANKQQATSQEVNRSCSSLGYQHLGREHSDPQLNPENPYAQSLKTTKCSDVQNGISKCKERPLKNSNLLNFQRHPELLQPYDPEKNSLCVDSYQPSICNKPTLIKDEDNEKELWNSLTSVASPQRHTKSVELMNPNVKGSSVFLSLASNNHIKQLPEHKSAPSSPSDLPTSESFSSSGGSLLNSPITHPEPKKARPDVLPFRRQESAGPVLDGSRSHCSSSSSATPTTAHSLYKLLLDDQEDALYADNVNRHENRRYIPFMAGTGRDIDTGSIPGVERLIEKFDRTVSMQRRGRSARRNRIDPEDRKRARSVDSALPFGLQGSSYYLDEFSRNLGKSTEQLLRPSQIGLQKPLCPEYKLLFSKKQSAPQTLGKLQTSAKETQNCNNFPSLQYHKQTKSNGGYLCDETDSLLLKMSTVPIQSKSDDVKTSTSTLQLQNHILVFPESRPKMISEKKCTSASGIQATPDLLKGQQELSQQTNEETAKQILYNYLKEGSAENDDVTKRKVNLVFEKIQTLKSRAAGNAHSNAKVSDSSTEIRTMLEQKTELEKKISELQKTLDQEIMNQSNIKEEKERIRINMKTIQQKLEESMKENNDLRNRLRESEKEVRKSLEELFQIKMEREQFQSEIRDLQEQLSEMHDELDDAKRSKSSDRERETLIEELMQMKQDLQDMMAAKEEQEEVLKKRERELTALKGVLKEEVSTHDQEIDRLKEQHDKELKKLREIVEEATNNANSSASQKDFTEQMKIDAENQAKELTEENIQLKRQLREQETRITELSQQILDLNEEDDKLKEKIKRCQKEKQQLEDTLGQAGDQEKEATISKRLVQRQLEDTQRNLSRITHEQQQLAERLKEETNQKEQLKRMKNEMENERWQLDKTVEKLQKEMSEILMGSRSSTLELQKHFDEFKEKNRRELAETQKQLKDRILEAEKARLTIGKLQDEIHHMEEELRDHQQAHEESLTKNQLLEQEVKDLHYEMDTKVHLKDDRSRQVKLMEDKLAHLEMELDEERSNSDLLTERINRCREQMDQMRNELLQEKTVRQDLECDKISLERQHKDTKSRLAHFENSYRSNKEGLVAQMEERIKELEERLESEERDRSNLQLNNRRLERKVKELMMQVDDEHLSLTEQKDQLGLRLKSMKRQVVEAEEEIDRLESAKKKLQRDLEEQTDVSEQLQSQLNAARKDLSRRRNSPNKMLNDLEEDDDDFSTDGDSLYSVPSVYKFSKDSGLIS
uniref:Cingulin-like protein 1 n=1 Tax=Geotrypetes seraphini TaxID=260995 RepID=A0A6P8P496_GEOSA|nr:cingulin-like protein 1 [Geotrypetes seraphini]XP_033775781.1 cingulin-like protein 1 [Geotrypetes seraphini]XP_033775782.1 cingulin-like protein 1 [Geotrypetes seraphini]XP_033775783.1 cingulin-like protein 1 [Geotrypetes seraphini]